MIKVKSVVFSLGLRLLSCLLAVSLCLTLVFNTQAVLAQEVPFSCSSELGAGIAVTFLNSECNKVSLGAPTTFYRYYSDNSNKYGRYLTTDNDQTNVEVIQELALNQDWGNKATFKETVTLPAGTTVYQGIVAPQTPASCYPGGGNQTFIQNSKDPNIIWSDAGNMVVEPFSCQIP